MTRNTGLFRVTALLLIFITVCAQALHSSDLKKRTEKKSPAAALAWGALVPGGGEFYTGKHVKGLIFLSIGAYLGVSACSHWKKSRDAYDQYERTGTDADYIVYSKEYDDAQMFLYYYIILLAVSIIDSVSEAYLSDWDVEDFKLEQEKLDDGKLALYIKREF